MVCLELASVTTHVFADESKDRGYLLVAAVVVPDDLGAVRTLVRGLVMKGQRRVHMTKESDPRRRKIASALCASGVQATIYDAGRAYRNELAARAACLSKLVDDTAKLGPGLLVLEQDDSLLNWDRQRLIEITRAVGCKNTLRYEHRRAAAEQLLALPDAIGWCWAKGGDWRRRIAPVVTTVRRL